MDQDPHPLILRFRSLGQPEVECQGIYQGPFEMAVPWVYDHPGSLVHHQEVFILVDYVKRDVLGQDLQSAPPVRHHELDYVPWPDGHVGLCGLVTD